MNSKKSNKPFQIIVKVAKRTTYWIASPNGGYLQLPKDEVLHAIQVESAVLYRPDQKGLERIQHLLTRTIDSDPSSK